MLNLAGKGVIYTAITGGKDVLREPRHLLPGVEYVCFTDDPHLTSKAWMVRLIEFANDDPILVARRPKLLAHLYLQDFDWSLWIDGNRGIRGDLAPFIGEHLGLGAFLGFRQYARTCAYQVAEACIELGKDRPEVLLAQVARYRSLGMPEGRPVVASGVLLRRHNDPAIIQTMELWWREVEAGSRRDQLSLPYVLWSHPTDFHWFYGGGRPYFDELPFLPLRRHAIESSVASWPVPPA